MPVLAAVLALVVALLVPSAASADLVVNEVESNDPVVADFIEIKNTGAAQENLGGYVVKDSNDNNSFSIPPGTMVAAGGYYVAEVAPSFGLSEADSARLFAPGDLVNPIDAYSWTAHAAATWGRCPDGTGTFLGTTASTKGATNGCPVATVWPGGATVAFADDAATFTGNLSGLAIQPSGTSAPGVLYAVSNNPGTLYRMLWDGSKWVKDTANGWSAGKTLKFPGNVGNVDSEGVTLAGGDANGIFVATERDNNGGVSRPAVLRFDVTDPATTLVATRDWNLTVDLPGLDANGSLEAVAWIADDFLVAKGFEKQDGTAYVPADFAGHGTGLFFVGIEQTGQIVAYALNQSADTSTRVASFSSGFPQVMALDFEAESTHLWSVCDNGCNGRLATLDIAQSGAEDGTFVPTNVYQRPAGMADLNNEGFAIAPQGECVGARKPVFWADDSDTDTHSIRSGTISCSLPQGTPTVTPTPTPTATATVGPTPDTTRPVLTRVSASRKRIAFTASEKVSATVTVERRKKGKFKRVKRFTVTGLGAGAKTTIRFKGRIPAAKLKKGRLRITLLVKDAAGNATTVRKTVS